MPYKPTDDLTQQCYNLYQQSKKNLESDCYHLEDEVIVLLFESLVRARKEQADTQKHNRELFKKLDNAETKLLTILNKQLKEKGLSLHEALLKEEAEKSAIPEEGKSDINIAEMLSRIFKKKKEV